MAHYKASSDNTRTFHLIKNNEISGTLKYNKWFSFEAEISLPNNAQYLLKPKGLWDSTVELKQADNTLLEFKMGWKGIVIKTWLNGAETTYLLKLKGLLSSKFVLVDAAEKELLAIESDFDLSKFRLDYSLETTSEFEALKGKELLLLTTLHCANFSITSYVAGT